MSALAPRSFQALRHRGFRIFLACSVLAMSADITEHVISYWVIFQKFHSPLLGGLAVVSHWLPYLLFAVYTGALAERFDVRRLIQIGMGLFVLVSLGWGWVFLSGRLEMWHAIVLLIIHGLAGVFWVPATQLLLHDIVPLEDLPSAVRLGATGRYLGMLAGQGVGAMMLLVLGPVRGIFVNALVYLPMILWLVKAPYGPRFRKGPKVPARIVRGFGDIAATFRIVRDNPVLLSMTLLAGASSFFIGNAYQAQMPGFAHDLGLGDPGPVYGALLGADAFGALVAGIVLESRGLLRPQPRTAFGLALIWCIALGCFALVHSYPLALGLLALAGFVELAFNSMAQSLVQLNAPVDYRGQVIGVFAMASSGLRMFSGLTVGIVGDVIGIHHSLALAAAAFLVTALGLGQLLSRRRS